ncbi:MAG: hypothetical protein ACMUJM_14485 [bacterium]
MGNLTKIYYRISENSYRKEKISTKETCLRNFLDCFDTVPIQLLCDNVSDGFYTTVKDMVQHHNVDVYKSNVGNAGAFQLAVKSAIETLSDEHIVYLVEDDYLHMNDAKRILEEGFSTFSNVDYLSLYDHPDKYSTLYHFGEVTKIIASRSTHWKCSISTTMTFAARIKALREDKEIWDFFTRAHHPLDHQAFISLRKKGRILITSIPGRSTHAEPKFLSPFIDWYAIIRKYEQVG